MSIQEKTERQHWMSVLAKAEFAQLKAHWANLKLVPAYSFIRKPEIGLAQVRARMGATGNAFNMGDVTVTRTVVQLESGELGFSYITGRNKEHAVLAAVVDAMMQQTGHQSGLLKESLITPLEALRDEQVKQRSREVATSKVDFFTLVRGEDD
ncbi:phosphonate C-P lyase system protein PhnG [Parasalinivibrio latis]|uniref:phosphonate C-P lyase system protein PhnG n=1 Tax=Parasalinivibrio latis TaxID=2952610 RepID=UPI0030E2CAFE